jgi:hypothetical protein
METMLVENGWGFVTEEFANSMLSVRLKEL